MTERRTFCEECRKDVVYKIEKEKVQRELKGESIEFIEKKAICDACESEVYVAEINDYNLKALYDAYREKHSIISLENILEIPKKYGIGKRPLSLLLGWGEMTFSRYCDGYMPSKQYSDELIRIYGDPQYYRSKLEENREKLVSQAAYEKSRRKTDELLGLNGELQSKMDDVIEYLLCRCEDITPLALQKALYYIQGFYHAFNGEFLFEEDCEAWVHGPVYPKIYQRYRSYCFEPIEGGETCNESVFTDKEKVIIDSVIRNICCYSGKVLEDFTHVESPWLETRGDLGTMDASKRTIHKKEIAEYFKTVKVQYEMISPIDIERYAEKMFEQTK